jgi:lipid II isoglutaminyl synthase (glutamine-hydrolysing)
MPNTIPLLIGKGIIFASNAFNLGSGSTWPGHIALKLNKNFIKDILKNSRTKIIIVAGTNGKTTTGKLIASLLEAEGKTITHNKAGANLVNGLASTLIANVNSMGKLRSNYIIFESDENALPHILKEVNPDYVVCLNLFRDQLDRYGEIDSIARKWNEAFQKLSDKTTLILNADDPTISYLSRGTKSKSKFFGIDIEGEKGTKHGADSTHCPKCSEKLDFSKVFFSHLGIWKCPNCKLKRPEPEIDKLKAYPMPGTHNRYNSHAAALIAKLEGINETLTEKTFQTFVPAFGRGEKITHNGKSIQVFLSKNPTSFNQSLSTVKELGGKNILILLNDRIPDGLDVSWIWDINFEEILDKEMNLAVSGDRVFDMALRLKYSGAFTHIETEPERALDFMTKEMENDETLYILPNYSAMLDIRKVLTGKKIL